MQNNDNSVYIITGATSGIGREIALALARQGKNLILACRNCAKADEVRQEIIMVADNCNIIVEKLNLNSRRSIVDFAKRIKDANVPVHALINNAGVMCRRFSLTEDGIEESIAVNYFGTVLLTNLLIDKIEKGGKIIFTTSITRKFHRINNELLNINEHNFSQLGTYGRSKCAITLYSLHLASILGSRGIAVNCSDPGIVDSGMITMKRWFDPIANTIFRPLISSACDGARVAMKALEATDSGYIYTQNGRKQMSSKALHQEESQSLIISTNSILKLT